MRIAHRAHEGFMRARHGIAARSGPHSWGGLRRSGRHAGSGLWRSLRRSRHACRARRRSRCSACLCQLPGGCIFQNRRGLHSRARRVRPPNVVAAHGQRCCRELRLRRQRAVAVPQQIPVDCHAGHCQTRQPGQQAHIRCLPGGVQCNHGCRIAQRLAHQPGEHGARAHFNKDAPARSLHVLQLLRKLHGLCQLRRQHAAHCLRIAGVWRRTGVVVNRQARLAKLYAAQKLLQRLARRAHGHGVERSCHRQPAEHNLLLGQQRLQPLQHQQRASHHRLLRAVVICNHAGSQLARQQRRQLLCRVHHRRHRARMHAGYFRHQFTALAAEAQAVIALQHAGCMQRHNLAEAMPAHQLRLHARSCQHRQIRQAHRAECGLRILCGAQLLLLAGRLGRVHRRRRINQIAQALRTQQPEALLLLPHFHCGLKVHRQFRGHAHALAALPWK